MDARVLWKSYERLGDNAAKLHNYQFALDSYKNMEVCMQQVSASPGERSDVYSSIWVTLKDLKRHAEALIYLDKDAKLKCHDDTKSRELMVRRCELMAMSGESDSSVNFSFQRAIEACSNNHKLKRAALRKYLQWQEEKGASEEERSLTRKRLQECMSEDSEESQGVDEEEEDEEDEEDEDESDVDLEREIDFCSDNDDDEDDRKKRKREKNPFLKLNKYGETVLQTACIAGDFKKVKSYITQGCPLNHRDHSGWLPIHDAANQGFCEIVELLIDSGSLVDDRGGKDCGGFTPLHSACANGHTQVVDVLLQKGFSELLIRRTDDNELAVELLEDFVSNNQDDDAASVKQYLKKMKKMTEDELQRQASSLHRPVSRGPLISRRNVLCGVGKNIQSTVKDVEVSKKKKKRVAENGKCNEDPYDDADQLLNPKTATSTYREAIRCVMNPSSTKRHHDNTHHEHDDIMKKKKLPAMVAERDLVADDWMVGDDDDVDGGGDDGGEGDGDYGADDDDDDDDGGGDAANDGDDGFFKRNLRKKSASSFEKSKNNTLSGEKNEGTEGADIRNNTKINVDNSRNNNKDTNISNNNVINNNSDDNIRKNNVINNNSDNNISNKNNNNNTSQTWLRVVVEEAAVMLAVSNSDLASKDIGWLANEVSERHYRCFSSRPLLTLSTSDGVSLFDNDRLVGVVVCGSKMQLEGRVLAWKHVDMATKYNDACASLHATAYSNIRSEMLEADVTGFMNLQHKNIQAPQLQPILHVIQSLSTLSQLCLKGNKLRDAGFKLLLQRLPNLSVLDVSSNLLSHCCLHHLSCVLSCPRPPLQNLERLHLSSNQLTDHCFDDLMNSLTLLPCLRSLHVDHCRLTSFFFQHRLKGSVSACLRHVDLQGNDFSNLSSSALLRLFSPLSMTSIKLSNVSCTFLSSLQQTLSSVKGELSLRHFRINGQTAICGEVM